MEEPQSSLAWSRFRVCDQIRPSEVARAGESGTIGDLDPRGHRRFTDDGSPGNIRRNGDSRELQTIPPLRKAIRDHALPCMYVHSAKNRVGQALFAISLYQFRISQGPRHPDTQLQQIAYRLSCVSDLRHPDNPNPQCGNCERESIRTFFTGTR